MPSSELPGLLAVEWIEEHPRFFLPRVGQVFARFGVGTQDSGNVSYGVQSGGHRFFVKTAGDPDEQAATLDHEHRVALLHNAAELARSCTHAAMPSLRTVLGSPIGPLLIYDWVDGDLLEGSRQKREDPKSPHRHFQALPAAEITRALDIVYDLHRDLAEGGWVAEDFYDGSLLYDFVLGRLWVVDLDHYHRGPFVNDRGRLFGSTRFMAPEELIRGAGIDHRTTVFTLGRLAAVFLGDGTLDGAAFRGSAGQHAVLTTACQADPARRFASVADFYAAWRAGA
jgi:serine/threonine protein kinase, bacterial